MKLLIDNIHVTVQREVGDKPAKTESQLLHWLKVRLNAEHGFNLIKKLMWKDGHLVSETQHYLRNAGRNKWAVMIWDSNYAIESTADIYNSGKPTRYRIERADED